MSQYITNNVNNQTIDNYIQSSISASQTGYVTQTSLNSTIANLQAWTATQIANDPVNLNEIEQPTNNNPYILFSINKLVQWKALQSSDINDLSTTLLPYALNNNVYNKSYIDTLISGYYGKAYIDTLISAYYTKTYIDSLIANYPFNKQCLHKNLYRLINSKLPIG